MVLTVSFALLPGDRALLPPDMRNLPVEQITPTSKSGPPASFAEPSALSSA
jgi:hypothetical protein